MFMNENLRLMREIDELHMEDPTAGSRRMRSYLKRLGFGTIARSRLWLLVIRHNPANDNTLN